MRNIRWRFITAAVLGGSLALWLLQGSTEAQPVLTLNVRPKVMLQRGDIRVEMRVERLATNRLLVLSWDGGPAGAGGSSFQLEGEESEALFTRWLKSQPPGNYIFVAALYNNQGKLVSRATSEILSSN